MKGMFSSLKKGGGGGEACKIEARLCKATFFGTLSESRHQDIIGSLI